MSNNSFVLFDVRGLMLKSLLGGKDIDASTDATGQTINTPGHCLDRFTSNYLLPAFQYHRPKQIIAVWDGGNLYREGLFPDYKKRRKAVEKSPELKQSITHATKALRDLLQHLGVVQVLVRGVEADDVIAWLAGQLIHCDIHTVDRDLISLSNEHCAVIMDGRTVTMMEDKGVTVPAHLTTLYKSLVGDTSDGYPGVSGFGPKKWEALYLEHGESGLALLQSWVAAGTFQPLKQLVTEHPGADPLLEMLANHQAEWRLSWQLAKLHPELVGLLTNSSKGREFQTPVWKVSLPDRRALAAQTDLLGCPRVLEMLDTYLPNAPFVLTKTLVDNEEETLAQARQQFAESPFVALDWETWAPENEAFDQAAKGREVVDMYSSQLTGAGFTFGRNLEHTLYVSVGHKDSDNLPVDFIRRLIECIPESVPIVAHNLAFESIIYKNHFGQYLSNAHCTKIMANHVDEHEKAGLKALSRRLFDYNQTSYRQVVPKGMTMADLTADEVLSYGADDPFVTAHLYDFFRLQLLLEGTWEFVRQHEFPLLNLLTDAYRSGLRIDWELLSQLEAEDAETVETNMKRLRELLREHQTSAWLTAGVENLLEVEREIIDAEFNLALKEGTTDPTKLQNDKAETLATLRTGIEERVRYVDLKTEEKEWKFPVTPLQISKVLVHLGLPAIEKFTKAAWEGWLNEAQDLLVDGEAAYLVELVSDSPDFLSGLKNKGHKPAEEAALIRVCEQIAREWQPAHKLQVTTGSELSLSSPKQMKALLYGMLCLPLRIRNFSVTGSREDLGLEGSPQANEVAITTAIALDTTPDSWQREALQCLLKAKKADTRRKNFYTPYPLWRHPKDDLIHPQISSVGTETRRMSGSSPNVMQISKRGEGVKIRRAILPQAGHDLIVSIDWSGEELRVAAGLSLDPAMLSCYIDKEVLQRLPERQRQMLGSKLVEQFQNAELKDLHSMTAAGIARLSYEDFLSIYRDANHPRHKEMKVIRGTAKTVNFGSNYGIGPTKLARGLICSVEEAKDYLQAKKSTYSGYERWKEQTLQKLNRQGYLQTLLGPRRHLYNKLLTQDEGLKGALERAALNFTIQGDCANYLKVVLSDLQRRGTFPKYEATFLMPIHDELVFSCSRMNAADLILEVHSVMVQGIPDLPCPLEAEVSVGRNFGDQIEVGSLLNHTTINAAIAEALAPTV